MTDKKSSMRTKITRIIRRRIPVLTWLPVYKKENIVGDIIAGITVGLTAVPQVMAYAILAGLTPEYGLYSSLVAPIVYIFLGTCPQVSLGPTAIVSFMTYQTCGEGYPECAILTSFYSGIIECLLFILRLGAIVSLISDPVTVGFTGGAALTIASSQVKNFLGLSSKTTGNANFLGYWTFVFDNLSAIHVGDVVLGVSCVTILILLEKLPSFIKFGKNKQRKNSKIFNKILWFISVSRNVIVVLTTTLVAFFWDNPPFKLTGEVRGGFPPIKSPQFLLPIRSSDIENGTASSEILSFGDTWGELNTGPFVIAIVAVLQNVAISKAYGSGQRVDGNQEMLALGVANIIGSFFSAQPTSGAFSRSALNEASGVRSPLGGLFTCTLVILSLGLLTSTFYYIPKASLASVIICAVLHMIDYGKLPPMWKISKIEVLICLITFFASIFLGMEFGIAIGVGISILSLLYSTMSASIIPELKKDEGTGTNYILISPKEGFRFPSVDLIRKHVNKCALEFTTSSNIIVIDCTHWIYLDFTAASAIASLIKSLKKNKKYLILINLNENEENWINSLKIAGVSQSELLYTNANLLNDNNELSQLLRKILPEFHSIDITGSNYNNTSSM